MVPLYLQFFLGAVLLVLSGVTFVRLILIPREQKVLFSLYLFFFVAMAIVGTIGWFFHQDPSIPARVLMQIGFGQEMAMWVGVILFWPLCIGTPIWIADEASPRVREAVNRLVRRAIRSGG